MTFVAQSCLTLCDPMDSSMPDFPVQYSSLGDPKDRGDWQAIVHGVTKESDTTERLHFTSFTVHAQKA